MQTRLLANQSAPTILIIALYPTKTQSALQGLMGDFFMVQVAAVTILNWK